MTAAGGQGGGIPGRGPAALFALTVFLAAALLFSVQPMIAKAVLPRLGGSPAVWTTCALFFQAALLAGYAAAHAAARRAGFAGQVGTLLGALAASAWLLPFAPPPDASWATGQVANPTWALLGWLARTAGPPFVAVAMTAPLLQRWYAGTGSFGARDPYPLYAASNAGSLAALLAYPLWLERRLRLADQSRLWLGVFLVLIGLVASCAAAGRCASAATRTKPGGLIKQARPTPGEVAGWAVLAFVPSTLMLGVTAYLTTDLAAVPLLWVVPLGLYLGSFILAFSRSSPAATRAAARVLPWLVMVQIPVMLAGFSRPALVPLHLATFFASAVLAHGELARRRPSVDDLTAYYLALAVGGALGGVFNAVVAPVVFNRLAEYPIALVAACLVLGSDSGSHRPFRPRTWGPPLAVGLAAGALFADVAGVAESSAGVLLTMLAAGLTVLAAATHRADPVRFALTAGALLAAGGTGGGVAGRVVHRERNFFGVVTVTEDPSARVRRLFHGSTLHGQQSLDPARRREPSTYFDRTGPVGSVFRAFDERPAGDRARVAVTGLGVGSLAAYARPGQSWTFFEIDPAVIRLARDPRFFTFLHDSPAAPVRVVEGDARMALSREPDRGFDLIVLDAFSSDAIPVHLLTREALALYRRKLAPGGLIVVNISNRYLDLAPVLAGLASDAGMRARVRVDLRTRAEEATTGVRGSIWAVLAGSEAELGPLARDPGWFEPPVPRGGRVWTDDFSSLLDHLRLGPVKAGQAANPVGGPAAGG